ncbi:MAG: trypsin-like serine protease [Myxococcales bacterium]|nr:trypsin-like serine protease [Myxococcales bacterium]
MRLGPWGAALLVACSPGSAEPPAPPEASPTLAGGEKSGARHDMVMAVHAATVGKRCTSVLLAPDILATARHCLHPLVEGESFSCTRGGEPRAEDARFGMLFADALVAPETIRVFFGRSAPNVFHTSPSALGKRIFVEEGDVSICAHDLAIVFLDRPVAPLWLPLRLTEPTVEHEPVTVVGMGSPDDSSSYDSVRRVLETEVTHVGREDLLPDAASEVGTSANTFETPPGLCSGDSGSPALSEQGAVVGIGSRVIDADGTDVLCTDMVVRSAFVRLDPFRPMIEEAFAEAGRPLWLEGDPGPPGTLASGEACADDSSCVSGLCLRETNVCATPCSADDDCGSGELCAIEERYCMPEEDFDFPSCTSHSHRANRVAWPWLAVLGIFLAFLRRRASMLRNQQ